MRALQILTNLEAFPIQKIHHLAIDVIVICCSVAKSCPPLCNPMDYSTPGSSISTVSQSLLKFMCIELMMLSNYLILCCYLLLLLQTFPLSRLFSWSGHSIGALASATVLPMNIQDRSPLWLSGLISLQSKGISRVFSKHHTLKASILGAQPSLWSNSHICMTTGKTIVLTIRTFVSKVMSLLFNMLSRFIISFLPRSKHLLISWLQ